MNRPYSPETLATRWNCSAQKVRQMVHAGELQGFRLGKLIRIPAQEVERVECLSGGLSGTEASSASPTGIPASELRLERMIGAGPKLSLVQYGASSTNHSPKG